MSSLDMSAINYTPAVISTTLVSDLDADQSQQATLEEQLSSGVTITKPSDNPTGAATVMSLQSALIRAQQYSTNASDGLSWLSLANSTLNSVVTSAQQAATTVSALSGELLGDSQSAITGAVTQLTSLLQQINTLANTSYAGQAIFAGTGNATAAYDSNGNYLGAGSAPTRTVAPGTTVAVSAAGPDVFGSGSSGLLGPNGAIGQIITDLQSGTPASLQKAQTTDLAALNTAITRVTDQAAVLGANYQRVQAYSTQASNTAATLQGQIGSIDNVDVAAASTQLAEVQQSYQSGLWATAQIEDHSLIQYLS